MSSLLSAVQAGGQELLHPRRHHLHQSHRGPHRPLAVGISRRTLLSKWSYSLFRAALLWQVVYSITSQACANTTTAQTQKGTIKLCVGKHWNWTWSPLQLKKGRCRMWPLNTTCLFTFQWNCSTPGSIYHITMFMPNSPRAENGTRCESAVECFYLHVEHEVWPTYCFYITASLFCSKKGFIVVTISRIMIVDFFLLVFGHICGR